MSCGQSVSAVCPCPPSPAPPALAVCLGAWQRRAALDVAGGKLPERLLRYGFFADANADEPRLLCKTLEEYEDRPEKDYSETIVLMISVSVPEPLLSEEPCGSSSGAPPELLALGPLRVSEDTVAGALECARFFPPGYSEPERKVGPKPKKKKKKRLDTKDEPTDSVDVSYGIVEDTEPGDGSADAEGDGEAEGEGEGDGEGEAEAEEGEEEDSHVDKATSPPPITA